MPDAGPSWCNVVQRVEDSRVRDQARVLREPLRVYPKEERGMTSKRDLIAPKGDKRYVRRDDKGRFKESDDQGRSLSQDRRKEAKTEAKSGQGDRGDRK
jgi:hypothetical protein